MNHLLEKNSLKIINLNDSLMTNKLKKYEIEDSYNGPVDSLKVARV